MFYDGGDITLQAKDIVGRFAVTRITAKGYLDGLVKKGILDRIQLDGRTQGYVRSEKFEVITQSKQGD